MPRLKQRSAAETLAGVGPLPTRVLDALGTNAAARLLLADRAQDLHDVLTRILRWYDAEAAVMWLVGSKPLLGGARPIDVLATEGAASVVRAIDGIAEGAFA